MEKKLSLDLEINKGQSDKSVKSIKTELRQAKEEAIQLQRKFGEFSPEAQAAAKRLAGLRDEMEDLNKSVQGLNPDKFARMSELTSGVVRGFQAASGAAVLFGKTGEDIEKTIAKLQATMAFADGIQGVLDARKQFAAFGMEVINGTKKMILAVNGFSRASKIALAATGIGLIVVALGTIVSYWDEITIAMQGANSEQAKANALYEKNQKELDEQLQAHKDTHDTQILQGKTEKEILETEIKITEQLIAQRKLKYDTEKAELDRAVAEREKLGQKTKGLIYLYGMWKTPEEVKEAGQLGLVEQEKSIKAADEALAKAKLQLISIEKEEDAAKAERAKKEKAAATERAKTAEEIRQEDLKRQLQEIAGLDVIAKAKGDKANELVDSDLKVKKMLKDNTLNFNKEQEELVKENATKIQAINKKKNDRTIEQEKEYQATLKELAFNSAISLLQTLESLNNTFAGQTEERQKQSFQRNKALASAETLISTYSAAQKAYESQMIPSIDSPIRAAIAAGVAIASGLAKLAVINKTTFKGSGGSGATGGSTASPTGFTFTPRPTQTQGQQPTTVLPPQKVYVLDKDIKDVGRRQDNIFAKAVVK